MVSDLSGEFIGTTPAPPSGDRVELTDLGVIQRWSLAVRGATADRTEVVAALRADLAWLERGRTGNRAPSPSEQPTRMTRKAPAKKAAPKKAAPKRTATKKAVSKSTARSSTARGGARRR